MKRNTMLILILLFFSIALAYVVGYFVQYPSFIPIAGTQDTWIQYWGSFSGSILGILSAYYILQQQINYEKQKKIKDQNSEVYKKFILKYYYLFLAFLRYKFDPYGGDKQKSHEEIENIMMDTYMKMTNDIEYTDSELRRSLQEWLMYQEFILDLKGDKNESMSEDILLAFLKQLRAMDSVEEGDLESLIEETNIFYIQLLFLQVIRQISFFEEKQNYIDSFNSYIWSQANMNEVIVKEKIKLEAILNKNLENRKKDAEKYASILREKFPDNFVDYT